MQLTDKNLKNYKVVELISIFSFILLGNSR